MINSLEEEKEALRCPEDSEGSHAKAKENEQVQGCEPSGAVVLNACVHRLSSQNIQLPGFARM